MCQCKNRKLTTRVPELHPIPVKAPWYMVGIDFIGPLSPVAKDGSCYFSLSVIASQSGLRWYLPGADPEFFCEGGQRGGALIIMVWAWLRNIARKRGRCTRGLGLSPSRFLLLSCYFGAFSLYLYHQGDVRHRPL